MDRTQENIVLPQKDLSMRGKFILDVSNRSVVSLRGKDALDLIQRLSTNEVSQLAIGKSAQTIFTNEKGKIVDAVSVLRLREDGLLLVGNTTGGESLQAWLEKYIIMDDAVAENKTNSYSHFLLYGPDMPVESQGSLPDCYEFAEHWNDVSLYHVLCSPQAKEDILLRLEKDGYRAESGSHFTNFRVAKGIPAFPNELSVQYNPMEAGLIAQISFTKGCYIGQEVIARLDTYKKVQKRLVQLELGAQPDAIPSPIFDDGEEVGTITSVLTDHQETVTMGLGYVKTSAIENKKALIYLKNDLKTGLKIKS